MYSWHSCLGQWFNHCCCCSNCAERIRVSKLTKSAFNCCTGHPKCSFAVRVPTWSLDLIIYALPKDFLPSTSQDHVTRNGILGQNKLCFRQMRVFLNLEPPPSRFNSIKRCWTGRSYWLFPWPPLAQFRPALPSSKLQRKWRGPRLRVEK